MQPQYAFMGLLERGPSYGYELKKLYDQYFAADKPILSGQVYSVLSRLLRDEKVTEVDDEGTSGGPSRTRYALTKTGQQELLSWLQTPEIPSPTLQASLYFKLVIAFLVQADGSLYLKAQRKAHLERMRQLTKRKQNAPLAETLLIDSALFHLEADLRWMRLTEDRLHELKESLCLN